jgi:gamma-glutamyltranspeptidase
MTVSKRTVVTCMLIACLGFAADAVAQGPNASLPRTMRPVIRGRQTAVSSMRAEATEVASRILQKGGNAFDAVVGGQAALAVTDFALNGIGSDAVMLVYDARANNELRAGAPASH